MKKFKYYIIYKPFQVLSQFSCDGDKKTLADFFKVEKNIYPIGRLDFDSEGLLILTNDTSLNQKILHPSSHSKKTYWVQVEGVPTEKNIQDLQNGVVINIDSKPYKTKPCNVQVFSEAPQIYERNPPIRERKNIATSWISITISEGKNRQIRKMTAAVGLPTLRLIRYSIETVTIDGLKPQQMIELYKNSIYKKLQIDV